MTTDDIIRYLDRLEATASLRAVDVAVMAGVPEATVLRWRAGEDRPTATGQRILSDLHRVAEQLARHYTADEARNWLLARHPQLDGERALDLIRASRADEVLKFLERLDDGAFL